MTRIALITGATSGIGEQFARQLAESQTCDELWLVGRNNARLDVLKAELLPQRAVAVCADLCTTDGMMCIEAMLKEREPVISLLINSAGLGYREPVSGQSIGEISDTLNTNCNALTLMCRMCLPYMDSGSGMINIASSAGFIPQPGFAVYAASKSYVISFSQALAAELKDRRIKVTCVCPGPVTTAFQYKATKGKTEGFTGIRAKTSKTPGEVARISLKASSKGRRLVSVGFSQKLLRLAAKILPHQWIISMIK